MKIDFKQLLRDLRAAMLLGRPEAIDVAMDGLSGLPGVNSNDRMSEHFIEQVVLPVGEVISGLKAAQLRPLLEHQLAVGRAVGAVALAHRFLKENDATPKDLRRPGNDPRPDVRTALGKTLAGVVEHNPEKILPLATNWITQPSPRLRHTALIFISPLGNRYGAQILHLLGSLGKDPDPEVNAALVDALTALARMGHAEPVLGILALWASETRPNSWVICRVLSASWAAGHHSAVKSILQEVHSKTGESSHISNALKALKRHGVEISL